MNELLPHPTDGIFYDYSNPEEKLYGTTKVKQKSIIFKLDREQSIKQIMGKTLNYGTVLLEKCLPFKQNSQYNLLQMSVFI